MRKGGGGAVRRLFAALLVASMAHSCGGNGADKSVAETPDAKPGKDAGRSPSEDEPDAEVSGGNGATTGGTNTTKPSGPDAGTSELGNCGSVPVSGRCKDSSTVEVCIVPSGGTVAPHLSTYSCQAGEQCEVAADGAGCTLIGECALDAVTCADANTLKTCYLGSWLNSTCAKGCVSNALGASCAPDIATTTLTGKLTYEARLPREDYTDWRSTFANLPAPRVLALSYDGNTTVDAVYTGADGSFTIKVPQTPSSDDVLAFALVSGDATGRALYAVADPGFEPRTKVRSTFDPPADPALWAWSFTLSSVANGDTLLIPETSGSGALYVYSRLHSVYSATQAHYQAKTPDTLLVWLGIGTGWDCGACMATLRAELAGTPFDHQLWLDGSADQGYWSDAVTAHELGHFVMSAYSFEAAEGGPHFIGVPTNPGQAWSEGFATFFSSMERDSYVYYDKQGGGFFWFDLKQRMYGIADTPWRKPTASGGLYQLIDENEVAALLRGTYDAIGNKTPILNAIGNPRMSVPPFERGYKMRVWSSPENPGNYTETSEPLPFHADFFDTLLCSNAITKAQLDAVTVPQTNYPFPSASPLCR